MDTNEVYTWPEVLRAQQENQYKHVCLYDTNGRKLVAYNNNRTPTKKKLEEIKRKLSTKQLPEGFYMLHFTQSFGGSVEPEVYLIKKGNPTGTPTLSENAPGTPAVQILTY